MKKLPGDIIILHMCNINDNHMVPEIPRAMDRIFSHIRLFLLPFYFPTAEKNQNLKKLKKKKTT